MNVSHFAGRIVYSGVKAAPTGHGSFRLSGLSRSKTIILILHLRSCSLVKKLRSVYSGPFLPFTDSDLNLKVGGLTCGLVGGSSSNFSHHESRNLGGELQQVRELLRHGAGRGVPKHLQHSDGFLENRSRKHQGENE